MGLNAVKKNWIEKVKFKPVGPMGAIPGMPELATWMMKSKIDKAEIPRLDDLLEMAELEGCELVACKMTVDMMETKEEDLVEGIKIQKNPEKSRTPRTS